MSWKDKMKDWGGGDLSFLSEDGEIVTFVIVGEPFLIVGRFKGNVTERVGCPVVTSDGFSLLVVGKRVARRLSKHEKHFLKQAFDLIRHGTAGDTKTTYELARCDQPEIEKQLLEAAAKGNWKADIEDAVKAAIEIAEG